MSIVFLSIIFIQGPSPSSPGSNSTRSYCTGSRHLPAAKHADTKTHSAKTKGRASLPAFKLITNSMRRKVCGVFIVAFGGYFFY